ncbi:MAG TPA: TusE/DsrC/DsvC family sulfur relay protein [Pseudomonadales bacterium]|jgi:tRNA 2-thiouridine synthesizing protein E
MTSLLHILRDEDGFLCHRADWNTEIAQQLALQDNIQLGDAHWEIIALAQRYFDTYAASPGSKLLVRYVRHEAGTEKGSSMYLMRLFGGQAAKTVSRIAGLPKPEHCL